MYQIFHILMILEEKAMHLVVLYFNCRISTGYVFLKKKYFLSSMSQI